MAIERLAKEIRKLPPDQRQQLLKMIEIDLAKEEKRGGTEDPFSRLIGKANGPRKSSQSYKEDLYGGNTPL